MRAQPVLDDEVSNQDGSTPPDSRTVEIKDFAERREALSRNISTEITRGWRVEYDGSLRAVLAKGQRVNHILHLLLCFPTAGFWLIVCICLGIFAGEKRQMLYVTEFGQVITQTVHNVPS